MTLNAPTHRTQYSSVNLWVDKESGALLQADAYDWQGKPIKRFEVISGQKIEGKWYLKQMRIEGLDPGDGTDALTHVPGNQGVASDAPLHRGHGPLRSARHLLLPFAVDETAKSRTA